MLLSKITSSHTLTFMSPLDSSTAMTLNKIDSVSISLSIVQESESEWLKGGDHHHQAMESLWKWRMQKTTWTTEENKRFESALAILDEKTPNRWFKVAEMIPGKSVYDVINQYKELVADVSDIEAGLVPIPGYLTSSFTFDVYRKKGERCCDQERKKGVPWTEEEHRRFLLGLEKHGKGDWRNIARNFVVSKTPTQVASHAQKYYLRQLSGAKDKRRPSIHDITTVHKSEPTTSSCSIFNMIAAGSNTCIKSPRISYGMG